MIKFKEILIMLEKLVLMFLNENKLLNKITVEIKVIFKFKVLLKIYLINLTIKNIKMG
jgi:hypothetical protein